MKSTTQIIAMNTKGEELAVTPHGNLLLINSDGAVNLGSAELFADEDCSETATVDDVLLSFGLDKLSLEERINKAVVEMVDISNLHKYAF